MLGPGGGLLVAEATHASYLHEGTGKHGPKGKPYKIKPRNRLALSWRGAGHPVRAVVHDGVRPSDFLRLAIWQAQLESRARIAEMSANVGPSANGVAYTKGPMESLKRPWEIYTEGHAETKRRYPAEEKDVVDPWRNNEADAFRHCYTSCIASIEYGESAAGFLGWANEVKGDLFQKQRADERAMDEFNNAHGRYFSRSSPGNWSCSFPCSEAATSGRLRNSP